MRFEVGKHLIRNADHLQNLSMERKPCLPRYLAELESSSPAGYIFLDGSRLLTKADERQRPHVTKNRTDIDLLGWQRRIAKSRDKGSQTVCSFTRIPKAHI